MTPPLPFRIVLGLTLAMVLTSCGPDVATKDAAAQSSTAARSSTTASGSLFASRPHGPGPDPQAGGAPQPTPGGGGHGSGGGTTAGGGGAGPSRQGGPFDVEAFENIGAEYSSLKGSVADRCGTGASAKCSLGTPEVVAGQPSDVGGEDNCITKSITYSTGTQPGADGKEFFGEGAVVTAHIDCSSGDENSGGTSTSDSSSSASQGSDQGTSDQGTGDQGTGTGTATESSGGSGG